mgnify:CR=1 FL=1
MSLYLQPGKITLAFYKARGNFFDRLIRWWTRGPYSHVELVIGAENGEATIISASPRDGGVRERRLVLDPELWDLVHIPGDAEKAAAFVRSHIGRRYDWLGILLSQTLPLGWHWSGGWFCSEICAAVLNLQNPHRYHPSALYKHLVAPTPSPAKPKPSLLAGLFRRFARSAIENGSRT